MDGNYTDSSIFKNAIKCQYDEILEIPKSILYNDNLLY